MEDSFLCEVKGMMRLPQNQAIGYGFRKVYRVDAECIDPEMFECSFITDNPEKYMLDKKVLVKIDILPN